MANDVPDWTPSGPPVPNVFVSGSTTLPADEYSQLFSASPGSFFYLYLFAIVGEAAGTIQLVNSISDVFAEYWGGSATNQVGVYPLGGVKISAGEGIGLVSSVLQVVHYTLIMAES